MIMRFSCPFEVLVTKEPSQEEEKFKLRLRPFVCPELYQSAYGIVLALHIAVLGQTGNEPIIRQHRTK
jgi:hypothetical protein